MSIGKSSIARAAVANSAARTQTSAATNLIITKFKTEKIGVLAIAKTPEELDFSSLKANIEKRGMLCPVLIAATPKNDVWLLDGYRRFYAAKSLDFAEIDAIVINIENKAQANQIYKELVSTKSVSNTDNVHEEKFRVLAVKDHDLPAYLL